MLVLTGFDIIDHFSPGKSSTVVQLKKLLAPGTCNTKKIL
jgi:hypothetical protein